MIGQSNVTHLLVGKDLDILANTATRSDLAVGQIGVFLVGSQTAKTDALAAGDRFQVVTKNSKGAIIQSPVIEYSGVSSKSAIDYAAPVQESKAIGFNGTSGSIDEANNSNYVARIFWQDDSKDFGYGVPVKFASYYSSASATQAEIAAGLVNNFNKNFKRETPTILKAEVLINDAGADVVSGDLTFVNGSKYVSAATDATVYAVGDYLRVGTTVASPCYLITAIDGTNDIITLDTPYQGDSGVVADAGATVVVAASAASADAGVKITALPLTDSFDPGVIRYGVTHFTFELGSEFGATDTTALTNGFAGSGSYWEVAQNEWFLKGNRGEAWRVGNYPKDLTLEATSGKTYDQISVNYATYGAKTIDRSVGSFGTLMIATEDASAGAIYASLKTVLGI